MEQCENLLTQIASNTEATKNNTEATKNNTALIANLLKAFYKIFTGQNYV